MQNHEPQNYTIYQKKCQTIGQFGVVCQRSGNPMVHRGKPGVVLTFKSFGHVFSIPGDD